MEAMAERRSGADWQPSARDAQNAVTLNACSEPSPGLSDPLPLIRDAR